MFLALSKTTPMTMTMTTIKQAALRLYKNYQWRMRFKHSLIVDNWDDLPTSCQKEFTLLARRIRTAIKTHPHNRQEQAMLLCNTYHVTPTKTHLDYFTRRIQETEGPA